ncbi:hypothetical protein E8E12_003539 [Didymella heteroderae]|uniref:Uncharacterized protein n=1 Tax=Didymella heteroderae TaxID=1769908 RepID=A0A9P5BWJ4_9PLEO|nr:hypothetical protein E8E12_003539 [Didymella heteroderae]
MASRLEVGHIKNKSYRDVDSRSRRAQWNGTVHDIVGFKGKLMRNDFTLIFPSMLQQAANQNDRIDDQDLDPQGPGSQWDFRISEIGRVSPSAYWELPADASLRFRFQVLPLKHVAPIVVLTRRSNPELFDAVNLAGRQTVYYMWYTTVSRFCYRRLTFSRDKLPALSGIASRIHDITKDDYLAGHWRTELGRSLFWHANGDYLPDVDGPCRMGSYRAPTWSWASVDGLVRWELPDLAPGADLPDAIKILDAQVEIPGRNAFGQVVSGSITMQAESIEALWDMQTGGWFVDLQPQSGMRVTETYTTMFFDRSRKPLGIWVYDDLVNGVLPGPLLDADTSTEVAKKRFTAPYEKRLLKYPNQSYDLGSLWLRGTYI